MTITYDGDVVTVQRKITFMGFNGKETIEIPAVLSEAKKIFIAIGKQTGTEDEIKHKFSKMGIELNDE